MCSSRVANLGGSDPFWYSVMSPGYRCSMETSLVVAEGSYRESQSDSEVGSSLFFFLVGPGSRVGSVEGGLLGYSQGLPFSSSDSSV